MLALANRVIYVTFLMLALAHHVIYVTSARLALNTRVIYVASVMGLFMSKSKSCETKMDRDNITELANTSFP